MCNISDRKDKASNPCRPRTLIYHQNTCKCANFHTVWWAALKLLISQLGQYSSADQWDGCGSSWSLLYMGQDGMRAIDFVFTKWWFTLQIQSSYLASRALKVACFWEWPRHWRLQWLTGTEPFKDSVQRGFHDLLAACEIAVVQFACGPFFLWLLSDQVLGISCVAPCWTVRSVEPLCLFFFSLMNTLGSIWFSIISE